MVSVTSRRIAVVAVALAGAVVAGVAPNAALQSGAQFALGTMFFAAVLWVTGVVPLPVTALAIPVLLTVFGVYPEFEDAVVGFADPVVFLLLSGFVLAEALQRHGVDRRVAYHILVRLGTSPRRLVLAVMVATALLSMVISNTATTAMMIPVAIGLVGEVTEVEVAADDAPNMQLALVLGIAYAASLGGVGTLIGTPPNAIVVGQLRELLGYRITAVARRKPTPSQ
ncbi:MAG: SLC13 family permease [Haloferacaceae archaeon]